LKWRDETRPNRAWADRYDSGFDRAAEFLERSAQARDREVAEQDADRRRKLRRAWQVAAVLGALLVVSVGLAALARREQVRADQQFVRADRNLALAKRAVDEMLMSAGRQSSRVAGEVPEFEEFRRELLEKAGDFYAEFGNQKPDSEALQAEIARAHFRLGDIYRLLHRVDDARVNYDEAAEGFATLVRQHPDNPGYRESLGNVHNWMGELMRQADGGAASAESAYDRALELQAALLREFPDKVDYRQELARTHYNRGILRAQLGGPAAEDYRQAIDLLAALATQARPSARQELARALNNYGLLLGREQRGNEAQDAFTRAIAIHEELVAADDRNREYASELAKFQDNLAIVLLEAGRAADALAANRRAVELFERLAQPSPALSSELGFAHNLRGRIFEEQGRMDEAGQAYRRAVDQLMPVSMDGRGAYPEFRLRLGQALFDLGAWQMRGGDADAAAKSLASAVAQHSVVAEHRVNLAYDYLMLARVESARGDRAAAQRATAELLNLLPKLPDLDRQALQSAAEELKTTVGLARTADRLATEEK
jgi:tetratricopeptide (TPR) repeat protein